MGVLESLLRTVTRHPNSWASRKLGLGVYVQSPESLRALKLEEASQVSHSMKQSPRPFGQLDRSLQEDLPDTRSKNRLLQILPTLG